MGVEVTKALAVTTSADPKGSAIYWLNVLIALITEDQILAGDIAGLNTEQLIELAKTEAAKAVENSQALIDSSQPEPAGYGELLDRQFREKEALLEGMRARHRLEAQTLGKPKTWPSPVVGELAKTLPELANSLTGPPVPVVMTHSPVLLEGDTLTCQNCQSATTLPQVDPGRGTALFSFLDAHRHDTSVGELGSAGVNKTTL